MAARLRKGIENLTQRNLIAPVVLFVISLTFLRIPLLNYLGYEFSVAISFVIPWIIGFRMFRLLSLRNDSTTNWSEFQNSLERATSDGMKLLLIPLLTATLNMFFVRNCSYIDGIYFFLLIPVVTAFWSIGLMAFCAAFFRRAYLMYMLFILVVLLSPVYVGYSQPQIYSYNFVYGYFPGFSYDEALSISGTFLLFRLITLAAAALLLLLAVFIVRRGLTGKPLLQKIASFREIIKPTALNAAIVLGALVLIFAWVFRVQLGFESSDAKLKNVLSASFNTEHIEIRYAPGSFSDNEIKWVAAAHEFQFEQVSKALQVNFPKRITSFIYPTDEVKRELLGTSTTNIAKPWLREIHLSKGSWQATLKHELTHVIAGEFGVPIIRAHYNIGLVEGLAMAVENDFGNRTLHEYAAALFDFDMINDPISLIKPVGFGTNFSSVSYVMMGSFCKYMIDRYGIVRFKELYRGRAVQLVYGRSYEALIKEWQHFLASIEVPDAWEGHVRFYFNRKSIFAKECARAVANMNERGYRDLDDRDWSSAQQDFSKALSTSWNSDSYAGLIRTAFNAGRYDTVIQLVNARIRDSTMGQASLVNLFLLYGDARWRMLDRAGARKAYDDVLSYDLSERFDEAIAIRLAALDDSTIDRQSIEYFTASLSDSTAARWLDSLRRQSESPVFKYLRGKVALRLHDNSLVIALLDSLMPDQFQFSILNMAREQTIAQAYFLQKQYQRAREHFWLSLNYTGNTASAQRVDEWLDRCEWYEKNAQRYLK